jgi:hypothetical protein
LVHTGNILSLTLHNVQIELNDCLSLRKVSSHKNIRDIKHTEKYKQKYLVYTVRITSLHVHIYDRKDFNVNGSVHRKNILIYIQQDAMLHSLFYLETALYVSGGSTTHHQERKQLHLQHLVLVTPSLLPAAITV